MTVLIKADGLSLSVPIIQLKERKLLSKPSELISDFYFRRKKLDNVKILDNISFCLQPGQRIGLIGKNGAGKSTLLRVLAQIYKPTFKQFIINGRISSIFEVSSGMDEEATGIENIYLRGLQLGLSLRNIKSSVDDIVNFSELDYHINKQYGSYSTGMRLRLSIAISTMMSPDIMLIDEWIGTGDANFNKKVQQKMMELIQNSRGLILATHNTNLMQSLCTHGIVLDHGKIMFQGSISDALDYYNVQLYADQKSKLELR